MSSFKEKQSADIHQLRHAVQAKPENTMPRLQRQGAGSNLTVDDDKGEGVAIANLIGTDGCSVVGWVYRWTTGSHAVMWDVHGPKPVLEIRPDLNEKQKQEIDFDGLKRIGSGDSK